MKKKGKLLRNPYVRMSIVAVSAVLIMLVIASALLHGYLILFPKNPHFTLKTIIVNSPGYWNGRSEKIARKLNLKIGETNLFALDLPKLRKKLKENKSYSIKDVEISKILPDSLKFNITERIPRALLYNKKSNLIVDKNGILLDSKYCVNIDKNLPIITGFILQDNRAYKTKKISYGKTIILIKPALALISLVNAYYPEFDIRIINLHIPDTLIVYLPGPKRKKIIRVLLPFKHSSVTPITDLAFEKEVDKLNGKLGKLKEVYNYLRQRRKAYSEINLLFDKQAIMKQSPPKII